MSFRGNRWSSKCIERIKAFGYASPRIGFERYFVAFGVYDALRKEFSEANFSGASDLFYRIRAIKDDVELQWMRQAGEIVAAGMKAAATSVRAGVREIEVLAEAEYAMLKAGSDGSPFRPAGGVGRTRAAYASLRRREEDRSGRDRGHTLGRRVPWLLRKNVPDGRGRRGCAELPSGA